MIATPDFWPLNLGQRSQFRAAGQPEYPVRLLIVPGLHGSGPDHWQSWLQRRIPGALRISVADWSQRQLPLWCEAIDEAIARHPGTTWVAAAHSFGCLALAYRAARGGRGIHGAVLTAPANPDRFGLDEGLLNAALPFPSTLVASADDPWMSLPDAAYFARRWGSAWVDLGCAGHINPATGFGAWPQGERLVEHYMTAARAALQTAHPARAHGLRLAL